MMVAGFDPGSKKLGVAVIDNASKPRCYHCIVFEADGDYKNRFDILCNEVFQFMDRWGDNLDEVAIESGFHRFNNATMMLSEIRGMIKSEVRRHNLRYFEYKPTQVKSSVYSGKASKSTVSYMVKHIFGLTEEPESDIADAIAVAYCHTKEMREREMGIRK